MTNLNDPTPPSEVKHRQGPVGKQLSYIDARFVMDRLDMSVGPRRWQDRYEDRSDGSVRCGIGVYDESINDWVWKWDAGDPSDIEATKGVHSDAFKRAGVKWGIGRDLYGDHPQAAQKPATATRTTVRPADAPSTTASTEPYPWDGMGTLPEAAAEIFPDAIVDESTCPVHNKEWRTNSRGYYCANKLPNGSWCKEQPSKAWQARHEVQVPA